MLPMLLAATLFAAPPADLPVVRVLYDNVVIDRSCRIVIPPKSKIDDADGNGVIQITAPNVTVWIEAGSVLHGSPDATKPDEYRGTAIRVIGQANVTIIGAHVERYKAGVWATNCPGLTVAECSFDDLWRQHLKSTPEAEDQ